MTPMMSVDVVEDVVEDPTVVQDPAQGPVQGLLAVEMLEEEGAGLHHQEEVYHQEEEEEADLQAAADRPVQEDLVPTAEIEERAHPRMVVVNYRFTPYFIVKNKICTSQDDFFINHSR